MSSAADQYDGLEIPTLRRRFIGDIGMMSSVTEPQTGDMAVATACSLMEKSIGSQVRSLLDSRFRLPDGEERRQYVRYPFPYLVRVQPVDSQNWLPCGDLVVTVGKQLSEKGIDFYHQYPLPFRHAIASLPLPRGDWISLLVDLKWCRFNEFGWYENGGRFLKVMETR